MNVQYCIVGMGTQTFLPLHSTLITYSSVIHLQTKFTHKQLADSLVIEWADQVMRWHRLADVRMLMDECSYLVRGLRVQWQGTPVAGAYGAYQFRGNIAQLI